MAQTVRGWEHTLTIVPFAIAVVALAGCGRGSGGGDRKSEATAPSPVKPAARTTSWKIKAHRGASAAAPENTLRAVRLAFQRGAVACEVDVRVTADGAVVVFHDEDTKRIGERERLVREQTLAELKQLDIGAWKGQEFAGERIVTLAELLGQIPRDRILFVEIKDGRAAVPAVIGAIDGAGGSVTVAIESFDPEVLRAVKAQRPGLPTHLTLGVEKGPGGRPLPYDPALVPAAAKLGVAGLAVDVRGVTREFAAAVADAGLELGVWTVNQAEVARALADLPIAWLETDVPGLFRAENR